MNHDYAHCSDFTIDCPKRCFRAQLVWDLDNNPNVAPNQWIAWMHFMGTGECEKKKRSS